MPALSLGELRACRAGLAGLVDRFDGPSLSGFDATCVVEVACEIERLANGLKLLAAARVVETGSWADRGASSAPRWLAHTARSTVGDATRTLVTAKQLPSLPATRQRVRQGQLSAAQARELADAATADPAAERALLAIAATSSVAELRDRCRAVKAAASPSSADERYDKVRRERRVHTFTDDDGGFNLTARGTADDGALLKSMLDPIADRLFREAHREGRREPSAAYQWDALVEIFRLAGLHDASATDEVDDLDDHDGHVADDGQGDLEASAAPRKRTRKQRRRTRPFTVGSRAKIIVRVDHAALVRGWVEGDETCDIAGIGPIPVRVARGLLGEAFLALIITKGIDVHTVAHRRRRANVHQDTALQWLNASCSTEGCPNAALLQTDHTEEWARTHHTTLTELARPCKDCHDKRTRHGYRYGAINPTTGKRPLRPPPTTPPGSA